MRDTTAAAYRLAKADQEELDTICQHDPGMIRDVAAALIHIRGLMLEADKMLRHAIDPRNPDHAR